MLLGRCSHLSDVIFYEIYVIDNIPVTLVEKMDFSQVSCVDKITHIQGHIPQDTLLDFLTIK